MLNGIRRLVAKPDVLQSKPLAETIANTQSNPLAESTGNTQSKLLSSTNVNTQSKPLADTTDNTQSKPLADTTDNTQSKPLADTTDNTQSKPLADTTGNTQSKPLDDTTDNTQSKPLADTTDNTQSKLLSSTTYNTQSKPLADTTDNTQSKPLADTIYNTVSKPLVDNTQIKLFADTVDMHVAANNDELESSPETDSHVIETNTSDFQSKVVDLPATKTDINFSKDSYRTKTLISGTFESNSKTKPLIIIQPYVARHYSTSLKVKGGESNFSKEGVSNFSKEGLSNFSSKGDVSNFTPKESLSDEMSKKIAPISFLYKQHELRDHRCQSNI